MDIKLQPHTPFANPVPCPVEKRRGRNGGFFRDLSEGKPFGPTARTGAIRSSPVVGGAQGWGDSHHPAGDRASRPNNQKPVSVHVEGVGEEDGGRLALGAADHARGGDRQRGR